MPYAYRVNEVPNGGMIEQGMTLPTEQQLALAVRALLEATDCVGDQLRLRGDRAGALRAALLLQHLRQTHGADFADDPRWRPGTMTGVDMQVSLELNRILDPSATSSYAFEGLNQVIRALDGIDLVATYARPSA